MNFQLPKFTRQRVNRTIKALQSQSLHYRSGASDTRGYILGMYGGEWQPKTCQCIEGDRSKEDYRRFGTDIFKCGAPVVDGKSWCKKHYAKFFTKAVDGKP